jgi:membrane-bound metal-dependent hydrolase YbcI (DUF457 family)
VLALLAVASLVLGILFGIGVLGNKGADYNAPAITANHLRTFTHDLGNTAYSFFPGTASIEAETGSWSLEGPIKANKNWVEPILLQPIEFS